MYWEPFSPWHPGGILYTASFLIVGKVLITVVKSVTACSPDTKIVKNLRSGWYAAKLRKRILRQSQRRGTSNGLHLAFIPQPLFSPDFSDEVHLQGDVLFVLEYDLLSSVLGP